LIALNGLNVLTGQPEKDTEWEETKKHHSGHKHENYHEHNHHGIFNWKENAKTLGVRNKIEFQSVDVEKPGFPDEPFDAIFMYDSLHHIKNRKLALNQCLRVLEPDGIVYVIEWNEKHIYYCQKKGGLDIDHVDPGKILDRLNIDVQLIKGEVFNILKLERIKSNAQAILKIYSS
jgi:SAM-dependent methyltransferase